MGRWPLSSRAPVPRWVAFHFWRIRYRIDLFFLARRLVFVFPETGTVSNLILEIGQETTVLTTLPFLVVSWGFVALLPFWFAE